MEAVGNEVIIAILLMASPIALLIVYYWNNIKDLYLSQIAIPDVPIQQPHEREEIRQQRNDQVCSICLSQPKEYEVSSTCGHSFCGACIFNIYERNHLSKVKCPLCRNQMSVLFKCFHQERPSVEGIQFSNKIRNYNVLFDDNRPLLRRILQFPYILKKLLSYIFSVRFLVFFLRNVYFIRLVFMILFYIILPFDILPQSLVGVIGFIDDIFIFVLLTSYIITIVGVQYYRAHQ